MKRSEMLKIMFKCFEDHDGFPGCSAEFVNDKLLSAIEEAGMLPPAIDDPEEAPFSGIKINEWELEDE